MNIKHIEVSYEELEDLLKKTTADIQLLCDTPEKFLFVVALLINELHELMTQFATVYSFPESLVKAVYEAASLQYIPDNSTEHLCSTTIH